MAELLEGSKVYAVPLFQRQYSWERDQWRALWRNLVEQYEFEADEKSSGTPPVNHFIGSFVLSPIPDSGPPPKILVIDGQQRLITVSVLIAVLRDLRWERAKDVSIRRWLEDDFTKLYLMNSVLRPDSGNQFRVLPTQRDREDFASTVGNTPGVPAGRVGEAYRYFYGELRAEDSNGHAYDYERLTNVLLRRFTLINVSTERGDNVHRVFQTLNSSGVRLKQLDLIRNHFFMLLPTRGEELYFDVWRDMELRLGESAMDSYFWASLVPFDRRVSRKTVFSIMQERLEEDGTDRDEQKVEAVLRELNQNSIQYLSLIDPSEERRPAVRERLEALRAWGTDTYYPLGLRLLIRAEEGLLSDAELADCFLQIESYLVRRMLVGIPTNNLNRIFSAITGTMPRSSVREWLRGALSTTGKPWPDNGTVATSVFSRPFLFSGQPGQRLFVVERIESWLQGRARAPMGEARPSLELRRALPPEVSDQWPPTARETFEPDTGEALAPEVIEAIREKTAHTLGNVFAAPKGAPADTTFALLRSSVAPAGLVFNRPLLEADSWDPNKVQKRSFELAGVITEIWPGPDASSGSMAEAPRPSERVVLLLPEHGYTLLSDLAELWAVDESVVAEAMTAWPRDVTERVFDRRITEAEDSAQRMTRRYTAADLSKLLEAEESATLEQDDVF